MIARIFITLAIFLLSGSHALADRFYAGADVAVTNIDESALGLTFQDRPIGYRLHAGYNFNDIFALEGSYVDTGEAEDTILDQSVTAEYSGYVVSAVLQSVLTTPNLFMKLGYHNGEVEVSSLGITVDDDEDGFAAGLGFRHELPPGIAPLIIAIRGEVDWLESDLIDNPWSVGIGLEVSFGN